MLTDLLTSIAGCNKCSLRPGGLAVPFIGQHPKCILLGEAPGLNEVLQGVPFVGTAGKILMSSFLEFGLTRDDFFIINSANCRPVKVKSGRESNGKPSYGQISVCWAANSFPFIKATGIKNVMALGSYACFASTGRKGKISDSVGDVVQIEDIRIHINYHPAATLYDRSKSGIFKENIKIFCENLREAACVT